MRAPPNDYAARKGMVVALAIALGSACSSESLPPPEPEVQHAGAFFAAGDANLDLYRTLKALRIEGDTILFTTLYDVAPGSFADAESIARQSAIPIRQGLVTLSKTLLASHRHKVVWFRTLTKEEEDRSP
jgi:hypothetical protein